MRKIAKKTHETQRKCGQCKEKVKLNQRETAKHFLVLSGMVAHVCNLGRMMVSPRPTWAILHVPVSKHKIK
jgi:hypothetical protein